MKSPHLSYKKISVFCAVLLLSIALGTGVNKAFASQNIQSLLTSWFETKKDTSIEQIDLAISSEKERLMAELSEAVKLEMQRAEAELEQFTADETALRLSMLQNYAANLIGNVHIDQTDEKEAIIANLDAVLAQAMAYLDSSITVPPPVSIPSPEEEKILVPEISEEEANSDNEMEKEEYEDTEDGGIETGKEQEVIEGSDLNEDVDQEETPSDSVKHEDDALSKQDINTEEAHTEAEEDASQSSVDEDNSAHHPSDFELRG